MNSENIFKELFSDEASQLLEASKSIGGHIDIISNEILNLEGKLIFVGIGKTGHIAKKLAATFSSTGTPSLFVHAAEAIHGDLGMISKKDLVIIVSNSGETLETSNALNFIKAIGAKTVGISRNTDSTLLKNTDLFISYSYKHEIDPLNLAPTTSALILLAIGDALAITVSKLKNFKKKDFQKYHPGGALGKQLEDDEL